MLNASFERLGASSTALGIFDTLTTEVLTSMEMQFAFLGSFSQATDTYLKNVFKMFTFV